MESERESKRQKERERRQKERSQKEIMPQGERGKKIRWRESYTNKAQQIHTPP